MASNSGNRTPLNGDKEKDNSAPSFECNICLETAKDAVVSKCGHLFCWPCLHQWLQTRPDRQICPVCKAAVSRETVVPLYSGGNKNHQDPRDKVPPRPQAQREEAEEPPNYMYGAGGAPGGFQMSFGLGAFPFFPVFGTTLSFGQPNYTTPMHHVPDSPAAVTSQQFFLLIAALCIIYMLFFV